MKRAARQRAAARSTFPALPALSTLRVLGVIGALGALGAGAGCGVPLEAPTGLAPVNTCRANADCALGAACTQGRCVATSYDLGGLILQVHPDLDAVFGGGASFLVDPQAGGVHLVSQGLDDKPLLARFDIPLPPLTTFQGTVQPDVSNACGLPGGTLPAQVTFFRVPRLAGLPFEEVVANTQMTTDATTGMAVNAFTVSLVTSPEDRYDVYIQPATVAGCPLFPPYLVPGQVIDQTTSNWLLPPIGSLTGSITALADPDLWDVALVEPLRGLPISAGGTLVGIGTPSAPVAQVLASISAVAQGQSPVLRLTPSAAGAAMSLPSVYWTLQGAVNAADTSPKVAFGLQDLSTTAVPVNGHVLGADGVQPFQARLEIQSLSLLGSLAGNAAFNVDVPPPTGKDGQFAVNLPPGTYNVRAFPVEDNGLSITDFPLVWPAGTVTCVCGLSFDLDTKPTLAGTLTTPAGQPLVAATVGVAASQVPQPSYLEATHTPGLLPARAETTTTDDTGRFTLPVDRGTSDFTVQTDPTTNYPWLVRPAIDPVIETTPSALVLTSPAFLGGTVTDPMGVPVANAQIDAWFPVRDPSNPDAAPISAVRIGTTTTDANGAYTLVLPSSI